MKKLLKIAKECAKEVKSWPKWKQEQAEQWYKQLRRDQEIMREYRETQGQQ